MKKTIIIIVAIVIIVAMLSLRKSQNTNGSSQQVPATSQDTTEQNGDGLDPSSGDSSENDSTGSEEVFKPLEIAEDYTVELGDEDEGLEGVYG